MTENNENRLSRRAFLTMAWRQETADDQPGQQPSSAPRNLILLGRIEALRDLAVGDVHPSPRRADIHAVRTSTGILALHSRCPNDAALVAWRSDERSEDSLALAGRFYCSRDASIFNRLGEFIAGSAGVSLPTLVITDINGSLWADEAKPEPPDNEERLRREFPFT